MKISKPLLQQLFKKTLQVIAILLIKTPFPTKDCLPFTKIKTRNLYEIPKSYLGKEMLLEILEVCMNSIKNQWNLELFTSMFLKQNNKNSYNG